MAVEWFAGNRIVGLSTDTKPGNASDGSTFFESDTGKEYFRVSGSWTERQFGSASSSSGLTSADTSVVMTAWDTYEEPKLLTDLKVDGLKIDSGMDLSNSDIAWDVSNGVITGPPSLSCVWTQSSVNGSRWEQAVRQGSSCIYNDCVYMFGGNTGDGGSFFNSVQRFNMKTMTWDATLTCTGSPPAARSSVCLASYKNYMYVFGGLYNTSWNSNDLWRLNLDTLAWDTSPLTVYNTKPTARWGAASWLSGNELWITGGYGGSTTCKIDLDTLRWTTSVSTTGTGPMSYDGLTSVVHDGYLYTFGGYVSGPGYTNYVYRLNLSTLEWSGVLSCSGSAPSGRSYANSFLIGNYMYILGGAYWTGSTTGYRSDLHRLHIPTLTWSGALSPTGSPPGNGCGRYTWTYGGKGYAVNGFGGLDIKELSYSPGDIVYVSTSWEASANNPTEAYCILKILPNESITLDTDLKAFVSMDDGSNWEQITGLSVFQEDGSFDFVKGTLTGLTARDDKTMRLKVTSHNNKNIAIYSTALGVKYS